MGKSNLASEVDVVALETNSKIDEVRCVSDLLNLKQVDEVTAKRHKVAHSTMMFP